MKKIVVVSEEIATPVIRERRWKTIFYSISPCMKMDEDRMGKGWRFHDTNFFGKSVGTHGHRRPAKGRGGGPRHENATFYGFIMRMVDQGTNVGMRRNTWPLLSTSGLRVSCICIVIPRVA